MPQAEVSGFPQESVKVTPEVPQSSLKHCQGTSNGPARSPSLPPQARAEGRPALTAGEGTRANRLREIGSGVSWSGTLSFFSSQASAWGRLVQG